MSERNNNLELKVENWAGKMHMKSIIIDDESLVIGSMNFTKQGENVNDENSLIISFSIHDLLMYIMKNNNNLNFII